jgi:hypothetical protein
MARWRVPYFRTSFGIQGNKKSVMMAPRETTSPVAACGMNVAKYGVMM